MSDDLIKREDAIEAIINKPAWHGSDGSYYHSDDIKDALNGLPSADRPQGEWKVLGGTNWHGISYGAECSNCKACYDGIILSDYSFCPNCGARMKGADDETD